jgi:hypothetical protein
MKRGIIITTVFISLWILLALATKDAYDRFLPGVPDGGRWPIASLPWLLASANTPGRPWNDLHHAIVWILAVATLFIPIALLSGTSHGKTERIHACLGSASLTVWALLSIFRVQYGYVTIMMWPPTRCGATWFIIEPMLWAASICALGLASGKLIKKISNLRSK